MSNTGTLHTVVHTSVISLRFSLVVKTQAHMVIHMHKHERILTHYTHTHAHTYTRTLPHLHTKHLLS